MLHKRTILLSMLIVTLLAAGCAGLGGPRLTSDTGIPTVAVLPSVTSTTGPTDTPIPPTPDFVAETETAQALVTPTLPPSRTPTLTWTPSITPSQTYTPSPPPTETPPPLPSATPFQPVVVQPTPGGISIPPAANCNPAWFFSSRTPASCPSGDALNFAAASLAFERGYMFWTSHENMIYVVYADGNQPAWDRFPDTYSEGMPERDPNIVGPQGIWQQPRRGFGNIWRTTSGVRDRLGWALREWEDAYSMTYQQASAGGTIYMNGPDGKVFELRGDRTQWSIFNP
ncbi:MAG: hypothetical protein JXN59_04150 [Anaerolineae bacterium]|nr:hypothetical protein [Anaerolineae bacterium]